jgi:hypothetical protein
MPRLSLAFAVVILASVGLRLVVPIVDHHAAERDPFHIHLVVAAGGVREYARALASHHHPYEQPHAHDPLTGRPLTAHAHGRSAPAGASVLSLARQSESSVSGVESFEAAWVMASTLLVVLPLAGIWWTLAGSPLIRATFDLPPPTPPPRASF